MGRNVVLLLQVLSAFYRRELSVRRQLARELAEVEGENKVGKSVDSRSYEDEAEREGRRRVAPSGLQRAFCLPCAAAAALDESTT